MRHVNPLRLIPLAAALIFAAPGVMAVGNVESGSFKGMYWTAQNMLTGFTNTQTGGPVSNGGDPIYWPTADYNGAVALIMDYGPGGAFICSGTLLNDRRSVLTAGHCVSDGAGTANPLTTTVHFQPDPMLAAGTRIHTPQAPGVTAITVSDYFVNGGYTGQVIDHNDIAVLRLSADAPAHTASYGLYDGGDLKGSDFTVTGYGRLGDGATGANAFTARLRTGDNLYDYRLGDPLFGTGWGAVLGAPMSRIEHSWVSDFDNGLAANDTGCLVAQASNLAGGAGSVFCDLGRGEREVGVAGGDSGGGAFIGGKISSVNSYGLTFGPDWGDIGPVPCDSDPNTATPSCLNSSFGEFSGYVPVEMHAAWIQSVMVPEPETYALMLLGLAGVGAAVRRRRMGPQG